MTAEFRSNNSEALNENNYYASIKQKTNTTCPSDTIISSQWFVSHCSQRLD